VTQNSDFFSILLESGFYHLKVTLCVALCKKGDTKVDACLHVLNFFVKCFYFVGFEIVRSCQECLDGAVAVAVPAWCGVCVTEVCVGCCAWWRLVGNVKVVSSSKCRPIRWASVYGIRFVAIVYPSLREFHRIPSRLINQWEQEGLWIWPICTTRT